MKNLFLLFLISVTTLTSCKKNQFEIDEQMSQKDIIKFNSILNLNTFEERKISFQLLSSIDKANFWKYNIAENIKKINDENKILLLTSIMSEMKPSIYDLESKDHEIFVSIILPSWMQKAKSIFKGEEVVNIFYILQREKIYRETIDHNINSQGLARKTTDGSTKVVSIAPIPNDDCMCNKGSSFTCPKTTTHIGTDGIWQETTYGSCSTEGDGCKVDNWGCGFSGLYYCNGNKCTY